MAFFSLRRWLQQQRDAARGQQRNRQPLRCRPRLEALEDRITPSFSPVAGSPFATGGTGVTNVVIGDFNRDGLPDMVTANSTSGNVSVMLGTGGGSFGAATTVSVGANPLAVTIGDFNVDGKLDLAVARSEPSNSVSVLFGNGNGTFAAAVNYPQAVPPWGIAVADVNGDGKPDLVTANNNPSIPGSVLMNNGSGGFGAATNFGSVISQVYGRTVAIADFNGDGKPDFVIGRINGNANTKTVVLNTTPQGAGTPTFGNITNIAATTPSVASGIDPVVAADINGDGKPDISWTSIGSVSTLINTTAQGASTATFGTQSNFTVGGDPRGLAMVDVNDDGKLDIATANSNGTASVRLGTGTGTFGAASTFSVGASAVALAAADVNGDGRPDLATAVGNDVAVLLNTYSAVTSLPFYLATPGLVSFTGTPRFGAIADLNGDGKPDVVTANRADNTVGILLGNGLGGFALGTPIAVGTNPNAVAVADLNRDGKPDLVVGNFGTNTVSVLLGNGDGTFAAAVPFTVGSQPYSVAIGDVNGDGKPDLVTANLSSNTVSVLRGDGAGSFAPAGGSPITVGANTRAVALADIDGDGKLDLVVGRTDTVSVLLGNGDGTFGAVNNFTAPASVLAVGDVNGDGKPDLATAQFNNGGAVLLGTGTPGLFGAASLFATPGVAATNMSIGDMNGDGKPDLVIGDGNQQTGAVFLGNGNGTFATQFLPPQVQNTHSAAIADINNDGKLDIVTFVGSGAAGLGSGIGVILGGTQPAATFTEAGTQLNLDLTKANIAAGVVGGTSYTITLTGGGVWLGTDSANVTGNGTTTLTVTAAGLAAFNTVSITDSAAGTAVNFNNSGASTYSDNFNVTLDDAAAGTITFNGTSSFTGTAALSASTARNIVVNSGASVSTVNGNLTLSANSAGTTTGSFSGVSMSGTSALSTAGGNIVILGKSGTTGGNGIDITGGADVTAGGAGTIQLTGTGNVRGVSVVGTSGNTAVVSSSGGSVTVTGTGLGNGVNFAEGGQVTGAAAGNTVTVTGTTLTDGNGVYVVADFADVSQINSAGGNVVVTGTGAGNNPGVEVNGPGGTNKAVISAGGTGSVSVTGTGGSSGGSAEGVRIIQRAVITSTSGPVSVTGITASASLGIKVGGSNSLPASITSGGNAALTLTANSIDLSIAGTSVSAGTGPLALKTYSAGNLINLGGADVLSGSPPLTLGLTDAELDLVTAGTIQIGDANSGTITVSAAITHLNTNALVLTAGTGQNINLNAGVTTAAGPLTLSNAVVLGASAALDTTNAGAVPAGAAINVTQNINLAANTLTWNSGATNTSIASAATVISGTGGSLVKRGSGTLAVLGVNTYTGGTTISSGNVQIGSGAVNAQTGDDTATVGTGTVTLGDANTGSSNVGFGLRNRSGISPGSGSNPIVVSALGSGTATIGSQFFFTVNVITWSGPITLNRAATLNDGTNNGTQFTGKISGNAGTVTIAGASAGQAVLFSNAANDFVGNLGINTGILLLDETAGSIPDTASVTVNGTGRFQLDGVSETIDALNGSGFVENRSGANTLTVGGNGGSGTYAGAIQDGSGALTFIKNGIGTQTLSGGNSYTGTTTINGGLLNVNGSIANGAAATDVIVNSTGTLGGTGTINGVTLVNSGGTLAPGLSPGILNSGSVTFASGSNFSVEINGTTVGTLYDQLNVTGGVTVNGGNLVVALGFTPVSGNTFTIINNDSNDPVTVTSPFLVGGNPIAEGGSFTVGATSFVLSYAGGTNGNDVVLTVQSYTTQVALVSGDLVVTDIAAGGQNDTLTIKSDTATSTFIISDPNRILGISGTIAGATVSGDQHTVTVPFASVAGNILVNTLAGNDTLTVDFASGNFGKTVTFNGGTQTSTPGDGLIVKGSGTQTATYTPSATTTGNGTVVSSAGTVFFTGLEPVDITGMATATLNLPGAADVLTLVNGVDFLSGGTHQAIRVSGTSGGTAIEAAAFWNNTTVVIDTVTGGSDGNDTITVTSANNAHANANLTINTGTGTDAVNVNGAVTFTGNVSVNSTAVTVNAGGSIATSGTGTVSVTASQNIVVAGPVSTVNGSLTLSANQQLTPTSGNFIGVDVAANVTSTGGLVSVSGRGGNTVGNQYGVRVQSGATVRGGAGTTVIGTGGATPTTLHGNYGVFVTGVGAQITASGGNVLVTGTGGGTTNAVSDSNGNVGVYLNGNAVITNAGAGTVTVQGSGGDTVGAGGGNDGVYMNGASTRITSTSGTVSVTGVGGGGSGTSSNNVGVEIQLGAVITSGAPGGTTVMGTGGNTTGTGGSTNLGVYLVDATTAITSGGGPVVVIGNGGGSGTGTLNVGVYLNNNTTITSGGTGSVTVTGNGSTFVTGGTDQNGVYVGPGAQITSAGGTVQVTGNAGSSPGSAAVNVDGGINTGGTNAALTVTADSLQIAAGTLSSGTGPTTLLTRTAGTRIDLGGADVLTGSPLTLGLTSAELNAIAAGTLNIGNTSSGTITVSDVITRGAATVLNLTTGANNNIAFTGVGSLSSNGGNVTLTTSGIGAITSGTATTDIIAGAGTVSLNAGSGGIGASGNPFVVSGTNLNTNTATGNGNQFLSATGSITIDVTGLNAGTGTVELDGGTFTLGGSDRINNGTKLNVNGGTFALGTFNETVDTLTLTSGSITGTGTLTSTNTFQVQSGTISAILAGGNGLTKTTGGTVTLGGTNTYTGVTTIGGGVLSVSSLANGGTASGIGASSNAAGNLVLDGGTLQYTGPAASTNRLFTLTNNGGTLDASGTGALNFTNAGAIAFSGSGTRTLTLTGTSGADNTLTPILGDGSGGATALTKSGTGTWVLGGANTYSGNTAVTNGTLKLGASNVIPDGSGKGDVSIASGATLDLAGHDEAVNGLSGQGTVDNSVGGAYSLTVGNNNATSTFDGVIKNTTGNVSLTKAGTGTLTLTNTGNSYSNNTTVSGGTLKLGASGVIPDGAGKGDVSIASGATLDLAGHDETINGLSGQGTVDNSAGAATYTLTVGNNNATSTFSGVIKNTTGSVALTKTGSGALTLSGTTANTFTGLTTVANGTLTLNKTAGVNAVGGDLSVTGGTLQWNADNQIPDTASINQSGGSVLFVSHSETLANFTKSSGITQTGGASASTVTLSGTLNISGGATFDINGGGGGDTVSANAVVKTGGALALSGDGGKLFVGAGGLSLTGTNIALNTGATGATIRLSGDVTLIASATAASITSSSALNKVDLNAGTRTFTINDGAPAADLTVQAAVTNGSLMKAGAGTLALTAANTYTGATTINGGVLNLTGSLTGSGADITLNASNVQLTGGNTGTISDRGVVAASTVTGTVINGLANLTNAHGSNTAVTVNGGVTITAVNVTGTTTGLAVGSGGNATVFASSVAGGTTGVSVANGGVVSLTGTALSGMTTGISAFSGGTVTFGSGDSIANVTTGLLMDDVGFAGTTIGGLTLNDLAFTTVSGNYVTLQNDALIGPQILDASFASFNGQTSAQMTNATFNATNQKLRHYPQDGFVGLIVLKTKYAVLDAISGNLLVIGTSAADNIVVNTTNANNVTVQINGTLIPNPAGGLFTLPSQANNRAIIFGLAGNDLVQAPGYRKVEVHGGAGNDRIYAGSYDSVLYGDDGNDLLVGGVGNDVLVGGLGQDVLQGGNGLDLLVGGRVTGVMQVYNTMRSLGDGFAAAPTSAATTANMIALALATLDPADGFNSDQLSGGAGVDAFILASDDLASDFNYNSPTEVDRMFNTP